MQILNLQQHNNIVNANGRTLDLVLTNIQCDVVKDDAPFVREDEHHPPFIINFCRKILHYNQFDLTKNNNYKSYNFRKANYPRLYEHLGEAD